MEKRNDILDRCRHLLATLGPALGLTADEQARYLRALSDYVPTPGTDAQLQRLIQNYHLDHQEVEMLREPSAPGHQQAWERWHEQTPRILRKTRLDWIADNATERADLVQAALEELHKSMSGYQFGSRFATWAYTVIVRAGQRVVRERSAAKRTGVVISLDDPALHSYPSGQGDNPETSAEVNELNRLINTILAEQGGKRWVDIFQQWVQDDQRLAEIGRHLHLSPSRVSVLRNQMIQLLRQHDTLRDWQAPSDNQGSASNSPEPASDDTDDQVNE